MDSAQWNTVIAASADPGRCARHLKLLRTHAGDAPLERLDAEGKRVLAATLAGSAFLSSLLGRHPGWLDLFAAPDLLFHPRRKAGLQREQTVELGPLLERREFAAAFERLHEFRLRELLRVGARDLARLAVLPEIVLEISNAADVFLDGILRVVWTQHVERFGQPYHVDPDGAWAPTPFCVLGLGKLGGQELNYSSDVDLMFVYGDEGSTFRTPPKRKAATGQVLANHQFFKRVGEALIREGSSRGVDAGALRIDMRLRPEGDSGPLARSLASYENFYAEWGQTWERMMLLKARCVAGDQVLGGEFLELVHPFRYPRSLGQGLLREMADMKARIEQEVVRAGELERNVKLGRGGIREIEFVAQALQVLHGGRQPFLQTPQTLAALPKLAGHQLLSDAEAARLAAAYPFLRDVEHRLQMDEQRQTHTLPEDAAVLNRIARLMGSKDLPAFRRALKQHTTAVRAVYDRVLGGADAPAENPLPGDFDAKSAEWTQRLADHAFRDPAKGVRLFREFVHGPGFVHVSRRTNELGLQLLSRFLELCPNRRAPAPPRTDRPGTPVLVLSDPDRVLARLDTYIQAYGARASLFELWTSRPAVFEHIVALFDRSEFLAELAIRTPDLVDELESGGHLRREKTAAQTLADLRHGANDSDQHLWLRRYFQTEFMRLGLRDILGFVDHAAANAELTALAEACIQYAVEIVARRNRVRGLPFAVVGLGKLGGAELVYGSDLDVIFVAPDRCRNLPRLQKLAGEVIDLLSSRTDQGAVFELDTRLRPDGEKGLLVNSLAAHEDYYRQRAMLWEIQALTRARAVAGDPATGKAFVDLARRLTNFKTPSLPLAAFAADWPSRIDKMRGRIETERTPKGREALAFKTGAGGLVDAEFLAQALSMAHGWFEPNTGRSLELARESGVLGARDAEVLLAGFRELRRMESILRRWSFEGEAVLPDDAPAQYRVAVRCGFADPAAFLKAVTRWRDDLRAVYRRAFPGA